MDCEVVAEGKANTWHLRGMISRTARFHFWRILAWDLVSKDLMLGSLLTRDDFFFVWTKVKQNIVDLALYTAFKL